MTKKVYRLNTVKAAIELTTDTDMPNKRVLWIHNKSLDEHASIVLDKLEFKRLQSMLEGEEDVG